MSRGQYYEHSLSKGSSKIVIIFTGVHRVRWGKGVNDHYTLLKNAYNHPLHLHIGSLKIIILKYSFGREGCQKESRPTLCMLLIMLTINLLWTTPIIASLILLQSYPILRQYYYQALFD